MKSTHSWDSVLANKLYPSGRLQAPGVVLDTNMSDCIGILCVNVGVPIPM